MGATKRTGTSSGVELAEIVASIALAADLGLGQPLDHVLRACVIATRFADRLGVSSEERDATYWTALFAAAGCTGSSFELSQTFGDDIAFRAGLFAEVPSGFGMFRYMLGRAGSDRPPLARAKVRADLLVTKMRALERSLLAHCAVSANLATRLGLGDMVVNSLWQTFARWDGKGLPKGVGGDDILLPAAVANIAMLSAWYVRERGVEEAIEVLRGVRGTELAPSLVDSWCADAPEILAGVEGESSWERVVAGRPKDRGPLTEDELDAALELIGDYADLKSPWFTGHSRGVASLAIAAARHAGLPESEQVALRRAALVHDIGRNGVPNTIWDKPGPLTHGEMERVRLHAYYTDRVLNRVAKLAPLGAIASAAHERVGGTGYPRAIGGTSIPVLARILEAADVYNAMLEDRPHRSARKRDDAAAEIRRAARAGELDGNAVDSVLAAAGHPVRRKPSAPAGLTPREIEVLVAAARGGTTRAIARRLEIAPKTAGNHLERIYSKIGASTRAEAAMFAMQHGLLSSWETAQP